MKKGDKLYLVIDEDFCSSYKSVYYSEFDLEADLNEYAHFTGTEALVDIAIEQYSFEGIASINHQMQVKVESVIADE